MLDKPTLKINGEEVIIKCNGDTVKFKDDNAEVNRAIKNMMFKPPDITPQLAISAFTVLHQYCSSISPHDCIRCTFTIIARSVSWGVRESRARQSENYKATNKIRESVFTGSFLHKIPQTCTTTFLLTCDRIYSEVLLWDFVARNEVRKLIWQESTNIGFLKKVKYFYKVGLEMV